MAEEQYKGLNSLTDAGSLAAKRKEIEDLRADDFREWALNRAFYKGNQFAFWNSVSRQVETLPVEDGDKPRYMVRLVSNQILPGVQHYTAQLTKTKPTIFATPDSGSDKDIKSAQMAERLYEYWWTDLHLKPKLQTALTHACLSQGYWKITWDPLAGKQMRLMIDPNSGQIIADEELADAYRDMLAEQQVPVEQFEKVLYVGDIRVEVMPGENVLVDPAASCFEEANYVICRHAMDPDEIKARWGVSVQPNSVPSDPAIPLMFQGKGNERRPKTTRDVFLGYFKPSPLVPKGRYVVWIEGPDTILYDSAKTERPWPFPFTDLPLVKFPGQERPNSPLDEPLTTGARPLNKELNRTLSQIVMHKNLTINPQVMAPVGSLVEKLTPEPGRVNQYRAVLGEKPEWREQPQLPQYVFEHLADVQQRLDRIFNRMPTSRDQLPPRADSSPILELMQESTADNLSPVIMGIEDALAQAGKLMAAFAKTHYEEPRLLKIKGAGGAVQVQKFLKADLEGGFTFQAESGSGLPRNRAGRQQRIIELVEKQILTPQQALKHLDLADMKSIQTRMAADEDQALREVDKILRGQPINPGALQKAMEAVQQGMNPETQQPIQDESEIQEILTNAALAPLPFENSAAHQEVWEDKLKSVEFEGYAPEIQQAFIKHYELTQQKLGQEQPTDPKLLPKVSVNTRSTASASVMGEILRKAGIEVTDEQVAELPLETAVYDSMDKPDADEAANDPLTAEEMQQHQADEQAGKADHADLQSKAMSQKLEHDQIRLEKDMIEAEGQERRDEEMHNAKLAQMRRSSKEKK